MGPLRYTGRTDRTGWRFWKHPALLGLGTWHAFVERSGAVLQRSTKAGQLLGQQYHRFGATDAPGQMAELLELAEAMMKRRGKVSEGIQVTPHADGMELLERWPTLAGWFTDPAFDDSSPRKGGWAGLSCRDGLWVALMKDDGEGLQITLSAPSPLRLLDLMEHALTAPDAPWRHDPKSQGAKPKKK